VAPVSIAGLRVNALDTPITIDDPTPRFTWRLEAAASSRAVTMSAFQLQLFGVGVGGAETLVFDTGKVAGTRAFYTDVSTPLRSDTHFHWQVRAWTAGATNATAYAGAFFATTLFNDTDWTGSE
jgi:alpha-L-rhamnosidase